MFRILKYTPKYEDALMELIKKEGEDWEIYWGEEHASRYRKSFRKSITYLAMEGETICGYSRSLKDELFVYVCDLLVNEKYRGNGLGKRLMTCVQEEFPDCPVYVMSGNDEYYQKLGCKKEGSIYLL